MTKPVKIMIIGAGMRGMGYAQFAKHFPERCQIVGVAEPRKWYREKLIKDFDIPAENVFNCWSEAAKKEKFCDAVLICTQDSLHVEPLIAFANLKYNILLEKPMAPSEEGCRQIVDAVKANDIIFSVCHVLRYTSYTKQLKKVLDEKRIGEIVTIQHFEPVGYWHQAHSFVRGNWRNEEESTFMLLAKSCHDMDWMRYIVGKKTDKVSSFGSLRHFRKSEQPEGATDRCLECPPAIEATCPYSAKSIYYGFLNKGATGWPTDVLTPEVNAISLQKALEETQYGRCVYACDNDVVDNQVVNMQFVDGSTGSFTMTAFTESGGRHTVICGSKGQITGDSRYIKVHNFLTDTTEEIDTTLNDDSVLAGHGGGDGGVMDNFIDAVANNDKDIILTGPETSLETHLMAFAGERSRVNGTIENIEL